jgi:hypothetical protein
VNPAELLSTLTRQLRALAEDAVANLVPRLPAPAPDPSAAGTPLAGRLLTPVDRLPQGNALVELLRQMVGDLTPDSRVRLHGWQRGAGQRGVALVVTDPSGRAVLGVTPGPVFEIVVLPSTNLSVNVGVAPWSAVVSIASPNGWDVAVGPGLPPAPPGGTATIALERAGTLRVGMDDGPGLSVTGLAVRVTATPTTVPTVDVELRDLKVAVLPKALARLVGAGLGKPLAAKETVTVVARADRTGGLRFVASGSVRVELPLRLEGPGIRTRGAAVELILAGDGLRLGLSVSVSASLPGLPVNAILDGAGIALPLQVDPGRLGIDPDPRHITDLFPDGIGVNLALPPVSGGGVVRRTADGGYAGLIAVDLGFLRLQAIAVFRPPSDGTPTSLLVVLAAQFPPPGIQLGLGFALDAVGGLVGINRRVDAAALQRLVSDGNADRVLFPDRVVERADEVITAMAAVYPVGPGRFLIGPMVRITWGGRMVSLSGAVVLELPAPVRAVLVGRLLVTLPDPLAPLIRLQASVFGRIDPGVPVVELLVSLAGSWIVGLAVRGEIYLLVRGGAQPEFVLSAGGFHPRFVRPAGIPALQRLQLDLAPGFGWGLRVEAYFAVTSNTVQFGGRVQLEAMIAGCGVEGWLGLDTLFVFEPHFAFSVHVRAGVAVRAFGRRLAAVALDFTLEGPAPWHAFGTGTISVLFWDVDLDFDIRWGAPPALAPAPGRDPAGPMRDAIAKPEAWLAERPQAERSALVFTAAAAAQLSAGTLVHPDSTLRVSQAVVPLGVRIARFEHRSVAAQTWTIVSVTVGRLPPEPTRPEVTERFVPGEFFDLPEEQRLTEPAFVTHASGVRLSVDDVVVGAGHRVDDGYETGYEPPLEREQVFWPGIFRQEALFGASAAWRLERWRTPDVAVRLRSAPHAIAKLTDLAGVRDDVEVVSATADAWQQLLDEMPAGAGPVQLVESWELG